MESVSLPTPPVANHRNRARRLRLFAPVFVIVGYLALSSVHMVWYDAQLPPTTVMGVTNVTATATLTAHQIAELDKNPAYQGTGLGNANPVVSSHFGYIAPIFWLLVALALGLLCSLFESTAAGFLGLLVSAYSWMTLLALRQQFERTSSWGSFDVMRGPGQQRFWFALAVGVLMLGLGAIQSFLAHRQERAIYKATHPEEPTMLAGLIGTLVRHAGVTATLTAAQQRDAEKSHHQPV